MYLAVIGGASVLMYLVLRMGVRLEADHAVVTMASGKGPMADFAEGMLHNFAHPLAILLAQILTIMAVARGMGWLFQRIGQPMVIGEIAAGIILGPSLLGLYFPEYFEALFPASSLGNLKFLSQIGLILFMFVVGMELDLNVLRNKAYDAVFISHASIVIPFFLGIGLAYHVYSDFAPMGVPFLSFALFLGIAMSITAFPVLARIVQERKLHRTRLGALVITCAAADDITAWCVLAAVIALVKAGSFLSSGFTVLLAAGYVLVMLKMIKPFLSRVGQLYVTREHLSKPVVALFFFTLMLSAYATEVIGIHALFGAFMAGTIMPDNLKFRNIFIEKVEDVALVLLLPLFFVFTGLRTEIGLLSSIDLWKVCALIIAVAVTGKFVGSALAARAVGQDWYHSLSIGALMNTRGLMELVVLNIGYDLGVLTPEIFAMMVIMALVTTFMTGPALDVIDRIFRKKAESEVLRTEMVNGFKVIMAFANPASGRSLLRLSHALLANGTEHDSVTALHLVPSNRVHLFNEEDHESRAFESIREVAEVLGRRVITQFKASADIDSDIAEAANRGNYDMLLLGIGQSIYEGSLLGKMLGMTTSMVGPGMFQKLSGKSGSEADTPLDDRTKSIMAKCSLPVGVLIDKGLKDVKKVLIPLRGSDDAAMAQYALRLMTNSGAEVVFILPAKTSDGLAHVIDQVREAMPEKVTMIGIGSISQDLLERHDLLLLSLPTWAKLVDGGTTWLGQAPSTLIIRC